MRPGTKKQIATATGGESQQGAAVLEVAVMLPILLVLLLGAIDLGRAASDALTIQSAAQAGAQYGSLDSLRAKDTAGIRTAVLDDLGDSSVAQYVGIEILRYCNCEGENGNINCDTGSCMTPGLALRTYVQVTLTHDFTTIIDYPCLPHPVPLRQSTYMPAR